MEHGQFRIRGADEGKREQVPAWYLSLSPSPCWLTRRVKTLGLAEFDLGTRRHILSLLQSNVSPGQFDLSQIISREGSQRLQDQSRRA